MPTEISMFNEIYDVATESEIVAFANKVRSINGDPLISKLSPGKRGDRTECLIAKAVNLEIHCHFPGYWVMKENSPEIADELRTELSLYGGDVWVELPKEIGNAAVAFDEGYAFQQHTERD